MLVFQIIPIFNKKALASINNILVRALYIKTIIIHSNSNISKHINNNLCLWPLSKHTIIHKTQIMRLFYQIELYKIHPDILLIDFYWDKILIILQIYSSLRSQWGCNLLQGLSNKTYFLIHFFVFLYLFIVKIININMQICK